jgi:mutator protein MutT
MSDPVRVLAAVIERDGRYLICRRPSNKRHGGLWEFPGGKLELGETLYDAALRELWEELGVRARTVGDVVFRALEADSPFVIEFGPVEISGHPACLEHSALAWVPAAELDGYALAPCDARFAAWLNGRAGP